MKKANKKPVKKSVSKVSIHLATEDEFSPETLSIYKDSGCNDCPSCGNEVSRYSDMEFNANDRISSSVVCSHCNLTFTEEYKLTAIYMSASNQERAKKNGFKIIIPKGCKRIT